MTKANFLEAYLTYGGTNRYPVKGDEHIGLPMVFDFDNARECAFAALRAMSRASGGHTLRECRLLMHRLRGQATVSASGAFVYYGKPPSERTKLTAAEAVQIIRETVVLELGTVHPHVATGARRWRA